MLVRISGTETNQQKVAPKEDISKKTTLTAFPQILEEVVQENVETAQEKISANTLKRYQSSGIPRSTSQDSSTTNVYLSDIFEKASQEYDVPYNLLVSVAKAESNFKTGDVSGSGAMGIMQLMPATAKYLGVEDAYDAEQNIMGGARYLSEKLKKYDGDVTLALASYNAGSGAVAKYGGVPPYKETQNYIKKITEYMKSTIEVPQTLVSTATETSTAKEVTTTTDNDLSGSKIIVGDSNSGVTLTYDAYLRYLELMDQGEG